MRPRMSSTVRGRFSRGLLLVGLAALFLGILLALRWTDGVGGAVAPPGASAVPPSQTAPSAAGVPPAEAPTAEGEAEDPAEVATRYLDLPPDPEPAVPARSHPNAAPTLPQRLAELRRRSAAGSPEDLEELRRILKEDPAGLLRAAAAQALRHHLPAQPALAADLERAAQDPDPRVQAAAEGRGPEDLAADAARGERVSLPEAQRRSPPRVVEAQWDFDEGPAPGNPSNTSLITIQADGSVEVFTTSESGGRRWQLRYRGWAWQDAAGNTVIDARGQPVELISVTAMDGRPSWGRWSPDSFVIAPDGSVDTVDDQPQRRTGSAPVPGDG